MSDHEHDEQRADDELAEDLEPGDAAEGIRGGTTPISNVQQAQSDLNKSIANNLKA